MARRWTRTVGATAVVLGLGGCAATAPGPLSLSLNELGSEVRVDAGSLFGGLSHRRAHNITGMGADDSIGALTVDPDPPLLFALPSLFSRPSLPDQLALRLSPGCSEVLVQDLAGASEVKATDVLALRDEMQALEAASFPLFRQQALQAIVGSVLGLLPAESANPAADAATAAQPGAAANANAKALEAAVQAWRSLSGEPAPTPSTDRAAWQVLNLRLAAQVAELQKAVDAAQKAVQLARTKPGLVVARWDYTKASSAGAGAAGVSVSQSDSTQRSGIVVLGAPRTMTLVAGDDLLVRACRSEDGRCRDHPDFQKPDARSGQPDDDDRSSRRSGMDSSIKPRRLYATTFQLLARHAAWVETGQFAQSQAFGLKLKEVLQALGTASAGGLVNTLSALDLSYQQAQQMQASASNTGVVSSAGQSRLPFTFDGDHDYADALRAVWEARQGYLVVSSMRSTLDHHATNQGAVLPVKPAECRNLWRASVPGQAAKARHAATGASMP